jgi:ABC-type sugar transport system substrate-binding protein
MMRKTVPFIAAMVLAATACSTGGGAGSNSQTALKAENTKDTCSRSKEYGPGKPIVDSPSIVRTEEGPATHSPVVLPFTNICPVPDGAVGDEDKTYTIGLSLPFTSNIWFLGLEDSLRLEAERHPNVKVEVLNANLDATVQAQNINTFVTNGVDAIVVDPLQEQALVPAMKRAMSANIPVIDVDRQVSDSDAFTTAVTGDFSQGPRDIATWVADELTRKYGEPKGVVAEIQTDLGSAPQLARFEAFKEVMDEHPGVKVVGLQSANADEAKAYTVMKDIASANPVIDVVYAQSEAMAIGAYKALDALGRADNVIFVGCDLSKEGVQYLLDGDIDALAPWTPLMGDIALRLAIRTIEGAPGPKVVYLPDQELVTSKNVKTAGVYAYGPVPASAQDIWPIGQMPG